MLAFKALHILTMFAAVAFLVGESTFIAIAIWRGDVRALAAIRRMTGGRPVVGAALFLIGIGFGLLTVATGGFDFLAGWLIAAYVMVVALFAVSALPVVQKGLLVFIRRAVEAEAGQRPAEEVARDMAAFRGRIVTVVTINAALFAALILDMVLKPF
jgi:hypothetical protein